MNHPPDSERAISDVIGAIVLISVIVAAFAIVGLMVLSQPQPQKIPALNTIISSNAQAIDIHHGGGDLFNKADIEILVDGVDRTDSFKVEGTDDWSTWSVGQSLICTGCGSSDALVQIVYKGGGVSQLIAQTGEQSLIGSLIPAPVVTAITPNMGNAGTVVSITNLAGSNFFSGATVRLSRSGYADITASNVVVVSETKITCNIDLSGSTGVWDVVVTNPGGPSGTLNNGFTILASSPPVADFSGTPLSGTVPLTVSFTDASANFPDTWHWDFGDGNWSNSQDPTFIYQIPGTYSVSLTATNTAGTNLTVKTNYITVNPVVYYTINATATPPGGSISPSGAVSVVAGNNQDFTISADTGYHIADVRVDSVSQGMIPNYTFTNVVANHTINATFAINQYTITATSGANGNVTPAGLTLVNYGSNQTYNITPITGYHVADVLVNNVTVGAVTTYEFTNVAANQTINATFAINQYTITPSITGGNGVISPDTVQTVDYGATPTFNFTPALNYHLYNITVNGIPVAPTGNNSYTFPPVTANKTIVGMFMIDPPVANFTGTPLAGGIPLNVSFTDLSTNSPTSWLWNFGDGNYSSLQNPTNAYVAGGNYSVRLEATNGGGTNVSVKEGYIFTYIPAVANFTGSPTSGPVSLTVYFTDLSTGSPSSWHWNFGDFAMVNTSTNQNPGHTYDPVGLYSVNLTVANSYSSSYLLRTNYINATVAPPVAGIYNNTDNIGLAPLTVEFWDMSSNDPTSYLWHFDDGQPDETTMDATHTFTNPGTYNVSHTATNIGGSDTAYMIVTVIAPPTVTSVAPAAGSISGSNTVTIIGTNLIGASSALFGGSSATGVSVINATAVSAITPTHTAGAVYVNVTTPNGTAIGTNVFTYVAPPTVTSVAPSTGPVGGGRTVTIIGTNLLGANAALFGGTAATGVSVINATAVSAITPAHALGAVYVNVTTPNGTAIGPNLYTYVGAPTITGISPQYGIRASGTRVNITGTNLVGANAGGANGVTFGSSAATINANTATVINMTAPAGTGTVTVTLTTPNGTATTTYNYFIIRKFTASTSWTGPTGMVGIDYLVVAGGGGGGGLGGGGGAGGVRMGTLTTGLTGAKTVTIGAGGAGGTTARASNGGNSVFATITATGGGGGGTSSGTSTVATGAAGGSGGGGARNRAGGARTAGQGNIGGTGGGSTTPYEGGGGGGNLSAGVTATNLVGGAGGAGRDYSATFGTDFGVSGVVAGGGGGGVAQGTAGAGGAGGGGAGAVGTAAVNAGTVNTGGGGGGSGATTVRGGTGGSGVVVIRYY